jgi:hypothetical protein
MFYNVILHYIIISFNISSLNISPKKKYLVQPYYVGKKESKSVAIIIPAPLVKEYHFEPLTTIFHVQVNDKTKELCLKKIETSEIREEVSTA